MKRATQWLSRVAFLGCFGAVACSATGDNLLPSSAGRTPVGTLGGAFVPVNLEAPDTRIRMAVMGSYRGGMYSKNTPGGPPVYDHQTQRVFVASADRHNIEGLDISDPYNPVKVVNIDLLPYGGEANNIALHKGILAATVEDAFDESQPGRIVFFSLDGTLLTEPIVLGRLSRIAFSEHGDFLVATISGSPNDEYTDDPESYVVIVELPGTNWGACRNGHKSCHLDPQVTIVGWQGYNDRREELIAKGVRILFPTATVAEDLETSGMTIGPDGRHAYVNLNVNNALAVIDIDSKTVSDIWAYGYKDHSLPGNGIDVSDKDNMINITDWPLRSFYQPKDIAAFRAGGQEFLATANEGNLLDKDAFTEVASFGGLNLDPHAFPNADELGAQEALGRIDLSSLYGDEDGDGDIDQLYTGGARSFSIFTPDGELIFDSGDDFEQITAQAIPECFNCTDDQNNFDSRSRKKGPEPEHIVIGKVGGRQYAFITFERISGIMAYDVTDPYHPTFQQYINNRNFDHEPDDVCGERGEPELLGCEIIGDLEPEAISFIPASKSPLGVAMLVVMHEASDSTTMYLTLAN